MNHDLQSQLILHKSLCRVYFVLIGCFLLALTSPTKAASNPFAIGTQKCLADLKGVKFSCVKPIKSDGPTTLAEYLEMPGKRMTFEEARKINGWPAYFRPTTIVPAEYVGKIRIIFNVKN